MKPTTHLDYLNNNIKIPLIQSLIWLKAIAFILICHKKMANAGSFLYKIASMKKKWAFIFFGWVLILPVWAEEQSPLPAGSPAGKPAFPTEITLPKNLMRQIEKEYPGARIAGSKDYCPEFEKSVLAYSEGKKGPWSYGALKGYFNDDKLDDYSLIIRFKNEYRWLAAIRNSAQNEPFYQITFLAPPVIPEPGFDEKPVEGSKEKICGGVFSLTAGNTLYQYEGNQQRFYNPYPSPGIVSDGSAIYYYWKAGKWEVFGY